MSDDQESAAKNQVNEGDRCDAISPRNRRCMRLAGHDGRHESELGNDSFEEWQDDAFRFLMTRT